MKYAKAVAGAVGTIATAVTAALADDVLSFDEAGTLASVLVVAVLSTWGVWRIPNDKPVSEPEHRLPGTGSVG